MKYFVLILLLIQLILLLI